MPLISVPQKSCDSETGNLSGMAKRPKIKQFCLIGEHKDSGLKDADVDAKILSLKISWIRELKDSNFNP